MSENKIKPQDYTDFSKWLYDVIEAGSFTTDELSNELGMTEDQLKGIYSHIDIKNDYIEKGITSYIIPAVGASRKQIEKIADFFGEDTNLLFGLANKKPYNAYSEYTVEITPSVKLIFENKNVANNLDKEKLQEFAEKLYQEFFNKEEIQDSKEQPNFIYVEDRGALDELHEKSK